uniref:Cys2/His2 zinc-finger transcription factor n=1 Tax=Silene latifolia TaxID=37657 RepID=Q4U319_SILLA|nr:Cys2/His2 zinc-finger transcription factor [Silene latifolia]
MLAKGGFYSADNLSVDSEFVEPSCNDIHNNDNDFSMKRVKVDDFGTNSDALKSGYVSVEEVAGFLGFNSDDCKIREEYVDCGSIALEGCKYELTSAQTMNQSTGVPQVGSIFGTCDHSIEETMFELGGISGLNPENNSKLKHICKTCEKGFRSGQALGGHRMRCSRSKRSVTTETKFHSEIVELGSDHRKKKAARDFICSVCCKAFGSGQALGGHMRAHFPGNSQSCEKKNDALDHDLRASEGEIGLNHIHNPHSLPALAPVS